MFIRSYINTIVMLVLLTLVAAFLVLVVRALLKYLRSGSQRTERAMVRQSLAETLKDHRMACNMTQEFVAEALGVSRQAVSKWETGASEPSTSNLLALAKLYGVSAADLLNHMGE